MKKLFLSLNQSAALIRKINNMKKLLITAFIMIFAGSASASTESIELKQVKWPFEGIFGTVDKQAAQRGYQVYKEVCASCHSMKYLSFRNLSALGFSEGEVKTIAAGYQVKDGPNDKGEMFERPGRPSDKLPAPFANEKAARAANNGAYPPDLSLIIKARKNGANYLYSLMQGYENAPVDMKMGDGMNYNIYFPGNQIAMAKPLNDGQVSYMDGTNASVEQMARDVTVFLQWAAEPEMEHRKQMGIKVIIFLIVSTVFFYIAKKRIWKDVK